MSEIRWARKGSLGKKRRSAQALLKPPPLPLSLLATNYRIYIFTCNHYP